MAVPKVIGTEIEYGVIVPNDPNFDPISVSLLLVNSYHGDPQRRLLWDYDQEEPFMDARGFEVDAAFEPPDDQSNMSINTTLTSGARYYLDHTHPEFSTPECTNACDIVRYEKSGERILETSRSRAESRLPGGQRVIIYKNYSDRKGNSYACHENYLMDRNTPFGQIVEHFMPFLVTRQIFCGTGKVGAENGTDPCIYQMSQRADFFETEVSLDTMIKRPLINTRDEPHADRDRLHHQLPSCEIHPKVTQRTTDFPLPIRPYEPAAGQLLPEVVQLLASLRMLRLRTVLPTGDGATIAHAVGRQLGATLASPGSNPKIRGFDLRLRRLFFRGQPQ